MTDRDYFAAAALAGLLVHANDGIDEETLDTPSDIAHTAFQMADAMLRGRTNNTPVAESATTAGPVAWAVVSDSTGQIDCEFIYPDEVTAGDVALESNGGVVPLYLRPQPTLTDAEREAVLAVACHCDTRSGLEWARLSATLRALLGRLK